MIEIPKEINIIMYCLNVYKIGILYSDDTEYFFVKKNSETEILLEETCSESDDVNIDNKYKSLRNKQTYDISRIHFQKDLVHDRKRGYEILRPTMTYDKNIVCSMYRSLYNDPLNISGVSMSNTEFISLINKNQIITSDEGKLNNIDIKKINVYPKEWKYYCSEKYIEEYPIMKKFIEKFNNSISNININNNIEHNQSYYMKNFDVSRMNTIAGTKAFLDKVEKSMTNDIKKYC